MADAIADLSIRGSSEYDDCVKLALSIVTHALTFFRF